VWFSQLSYSNAAVDTGDDEALTVPADLTPVLSWQTNLCRHGYFSSNVRVLLRHHWIPGKGFHGQIEKRLNALPRYAPGVIVNLPPFSIESLLFTP
jgi:hypothetical protein